MNTFQITESVLDGYINQNLSKDRIEFLTRQANEQIDEIAQNEEIYKSFLNEANVPQKIDKLILWVFFMSNEDICYDYTTKFKKDFRDMVPVNDLSDLVFYIAYLKKVKKIDLDGYDYLEESEEEGIEDVDAFSFTNGFLYIQALKEVKMEF